MLSPFAVVCLQTIQEFQQVLNLSFLITNPFFDGEPETKLFVDLEVDVPGHLQADEDAEDPSKKTDKKAATKRSRPKKIKM